jgi:hypothetical protein
MPNFESGGMMYRYSDAASATTDNTSGFGQQYLETIASNRAFVRAVRNALRIDIVGSDEINGASFVSNEVDAAKNTSKPYKILEEKAALKGIKSLDKLKEVLTKKRYEGFDITEVNSWQNWEDISSGQVWKLMSMLNKKGA